MHQGSVTCRYLHLCSLHCYYFAVRHGLIRVDSSCQCEALALSHPARLSAERRRKEKGETWPSKFIPERDSDQKTLSGNLYNLYTVFALFLPSHCGVLLERLQRMSRLLLAKKKHLRSIFFKKTWLLGWVVEVLGRKDFGCIMKKSLVES